MSQHPGLPPVTAHAGVGLRLPHLAEVVATRPSVPWLEVHPENFLSNPHATELLMHLRAHYPISVHTVGVSIGSASGIDWHHLRRVRAFIDLVDPMLVSGHLAWSTHEGEYLNDLLPLPFDDETLGVVAQHLEEVQEGLGRPYLLENPSSYVGFGESSLTEVQFLAELVRRTGCRLLCDVSNVHLTWDTTPTPTLTRFQPRPSVNCISAASRRSRTTRRPVGKSSSTPTRRASPSRRGNSTHMPSAVSAPGRR